MDDLDKFTHETKNLFKTDFIFKYCNENCFVYECADGCEIVLLYFKADNVCVGNKMTINDVVEQENITYLKLVSFDAFTYEKEKETIYIDL